MGFRWIGMGALLAMTPDQRQAFEAQGEYAININDLSGWRGARDTVLQHEFQADHDEAKRDQDWGEQEYIEEGKV